MSHKNENDKYGIQKKKTDATAITKLENKENEENEESFFQKDAVVRVKKALLSSFLIFIYLIIGFVLFQFIINWNSNRNENSRETYSTYDGSIVINDTNYFSSYAESSENDYVWLEYEVEGYDTYTIVDHSFEVWNINNPYNHYFSIYSNYELNNGNWMTGKGEE